MKIKRLADKTLQNYMENCGAVLITGPKYCGKTFLGQEASKSQYYIKYKDASKYGSYNMQDIVQGEYPRLIDEWQEFPEIWDEIRHLIDMKEDNKIGLYILTGSTKPLDKNIRIHSGTGRIFTMHLSTLTFAEILDLNESNSISLAKLATNHKSYRFMRTTHTHENSFKFMLMGGWPELHATPHKNNLLLTKEYIKTLVSKDIASYKFTLSKDTLLRILKAIARLNGTRINRSKILSDLNHEVSIETINKYFDLLYDLEILFDVDPWKNINLRSRYKIRTKPKTYFCDTSLVCRLLDINADKDFFNDLNTAGIIFETQVIKDLRVYAQTLGASMYMFRDEQGHEVDAIFEFDDGSYWLIEIKLSNRMLNDSIKILKNFNSLITFHTNQQPSLKLIITDEDTTQQIDDIFIIPHSLIRP